MKNRCPIRSKEEALSGSVSYAVEIYDAATNRLLNAYEAKQYPTAMNVNASFGASGASKVGIRERGTIWLLDWLRSSQCAGTVKPDGVVPSRPRRVRAISTGTASSTSGY